MTLAVDLQQPGGHHGESGKDKAGAKTLELREGMPVAKEEGVDDPVEERDEEDDAEGVKEVEGGDGDFGGGEEGLEGQVHLTPLVLEGGAHLSRLGLGVCVCGWV